MNTALRALNVLRGWCRHVRLRLLKATSSESCWMAGEEGAKLARREVVFNGFDTTSLRPTWFD